MNIQDYLSSGILELYAMQQLSPAEALEVEAMRKKYPEINREIQSIEDALQSFASAQAKPPPAHLKSDLLKRIEEQIGDTQKHSPQPKSMRPLNAWRAVAAILFLATSVLGYFSLQKSRTGHLELQQCAEQNKVLMQTNKELRDPATKKVAMQATDTLKPFSAIAFWNSRTEEVRLDGSQLPPVDAGLQYQLWAIIDGRPVNAGVFDPSDAIQTMKSIRGAQAFAVTIEKRGGALTPNLKAMVVMGKV